MTSELICNVGYCNKSVILCAFGLCPEHCKQHKGEGK